MSDGEIEEMIDLCTTIAQFEFVVRFLEAQPVEGSPYGALRSAAARAGVSLEDWIKGHS
jgi:hypothetical protein